MADFSDFIETMVLGDDHVFTLPITTLNAANQTVPVDLTNYQEFWFQVKHKPKDPDTLAVVSLTKSGGGIVLATAILGIVQLTIPRAATLPLNSAAILPDGSPLNAPVGRTFTLYAELACRDSNGLHKSLKQGLLVVGPYLVQTA